MKQSEAVGEAWWATHSPETDQQLRTNGSISHEEEPNILTCFLQRDSEIIQPNMRALPSVSNRSPWKVNVLQNAVFVAVEVLLL